MSSHRSIRVDRCVCRSTTFVRLKDAADRSNSTTVDQLHEHASFGTDCGTCLPYVRRMLRTGETVFHEIITEEDEPG